MQVFNRVPSKFSFSVLRHVAQLPSYPNFSTLLKYNVDKLSDNISLCVIGNGAEGNPRSLLIDYNERLFMFNCGEGLQRILPDFGFKSSKIEHFFITSNNWNNVSGLSTLLMARYDAGIKEFNITGLNNENIVKECISFDTKLKRVKFNYFDCVNDAVFTCDNLEINPIIIELGNSKSVVYLGKIHTQKGEINLEKCFKLRVPRHLVTNLQKGFPVSLENGETILPSDVLNPDQLEKRFVIFESLNPSFVKNFEYNPVINDFLQRCDCIIHFTKNDFLRGSDYESFMKNYNSSYHLLLTESNPSLCLHSAHRFQTQLHFIDPKLFPSLSENTNIDKINHDDICKHEKVVHCQAGLNFLLRPRVSDRDSLITFDRIPKYDFNNKENLLLYKDGSKREGLPEVLLSLQEQQKIVNSNTNFNYPEFVFLGTASSVSLPIRNVSSILVNLSPNESILLECGENTYGQLLRFYGNENIKKVLNAIKAVFISHHHSDHHMGLVQLIEKHHEMSGRKLFAILPPMVSKFLHSKSLSFSSLNNLNSKYNYSINRYFDDRSKSSIAKLLPNVKEVQLIPVSHCAFAYGISMTTKSGFKFVYSGDTEPCDSLIQQGRNCDLLIHESTVEDSLVAFARSNFHSTMTEAIDVARQMNARFTILTHFSQRYGKLPFVAGNEYNQTVGLAFDNMRISPSEFNRLPLMYGALKCMYSKHLENLEYRTELYSRKYGKSK